MLQPTMAARYCSPFTTKPQILICSALPNSSSSSPLSSEKLRNINGKTTLQENLQREKLKQTKKRQQPSVLEIERAIGAGVFRDRDTSSEEEGARNVYDNMLRNSIGKSEGAVEVKLRETGEWLIDQTERTSRSLGKQILVNMFTWIVPLWIFAFLVASGSLQLPFSTPFLEDLVS